MSIRLKSFLTGVICLLMIPPGFAQQKFRVEKDLLGEKQIPADAYYGVQTARALENFQISGIPINHYPEFITALAMVKMAAAQANYEVGALPKEKMEVIVKACQAVIDGHFRDQFIVDWDQGGAGTSTNMNANEVLANIALEFMGRNKGDYGVIDPHDELNMSQSTNDSYPTSLKVAFLLRNDKLIAELKLLAGSLHSKGDEYLRVLKMGRTEMQDAVPMTVGQEFHSLGSSIESEIRLLRDSEKYLYEINMGGTAIGTGLNAPEGYSAKVAAHLAKLTGKPFVPAGDMITATWSLQGFVVYSSAIKSLATTLSKIASDLILLSSGPRAGLSEISLPALQPGSSIMPGKVNPVMPELVNLVVFRVMGNDFAVTLAAKTGQLELNAYEPLAGLAIMESQDLLVRTIQTFRTRCVEGISVNQRVLDRQIEETVGIVTALNPVIGYDRASELAAEAYRSNKGILQIIREKKILSEEQIKALLDPGKLTGLDVSKYEKKPSE